MAGFKLCQEGVRGEESDAGDGGVCGEITGIERYDDLGTCGERRREDWLIIRIAEQTAGCDLTIVCNEQHIGQQVDQIIDALAIDRALDTAVDTVLDPNTYKFANDERAPDCFEVAETRQEPQPVPVPTQEHGGVEHGPENV